MSSAETTSEAVTKHLDTTALPTLYVDRSFWGMTVTQFLGAFNDNLFKQLVLLLSIAEVDQALKSEAADNQWLPMLLFAAPFLAFTGYAGFLADRYSKRTIVISCKVAEILVMALGGIGFAMYAANGSMAMLYSVLFLMAMQSAFFGPAKYGILPEMLRDQDLPRANGFMLMTTFLAIIFGTAIAGILLKYFEGRLWVGSIACVGIAIAGTLTSLWVRRVPIANPQLKFTPEALTVPRDMIELLKVDRPLLMALTVSSLFWLLAGLVPSAVNALGKLVLQVGDDNTSALSAIIGVGIAVGCVIGGLVSKGRVDFRLLRIGSVGMLITLAIVAIPAQGNIEDLKDPTGSLTRMPGIGDSSQWLGFWASLPLFLIMGAFTGLFAVPLQVFMQSRPPNDKKGRMIAVMNQANWIGILLASGIYWALTKIIEWQEWPRSLVFLFIAVLMLPIALFYHPTDASVGERPHLAKK